MVPPSSPPNPNGPEPWVLLGFSTLGALDGLAGWILFRLGFVGEGVASGLSALLFPIAMAVACRIWIFPVVTRAFWVLGLLAVAAIASSILGTLAILNLAIGGTGLIRVFQPVLILIWPSFALLTLAARFHGFRRLRLIGLILGAEFILGFLVALGSEALGRPAFRITGLLAPAILAVGIAYGLSYSKQPAAGSAA